jgi:hypothetical protein
MYQEEIPTINLYAPNVSAWNFIKNTLKEFKTHIDPNLVVVEDSNTSLSLRSRSSRQKINKEILELNNTSGLIGLTDV